MELYLVLNNAYVSLPSTAEHIVVHYTVAKTGPYSIFGLRLYMLCNLFTRQISNIKDSLKIFDAAI